MIISGLHKFIFVAIPKTGTHAVRRALRAHLGPQDIEQVGLFVDKRFPIPDLARLKHGHLSLQQVQPYLKPETFKAYFKFAFVRNPFDRFVSYCAFVTRDDGDFSRDPQRVMREILAAPPLDHILFQPQNSFIAGADGALLAGHIGRVEDMQRSYDAICARIGIPSASLERVNATDRRDYRDYYDPELIEQVAKLYARDLELFGYEY